MAITDQTTTTTKPFFDLPAELRNTIYELALHNHGKTLIFTKPTKQNKKGRPKAPPILLASKQIHAETLGLFYNTTTFHFELPKKMLCWLRKLGAEKRSLLRNVVVEESIGLALDYRFPGGFQHPDGVCNKEGVVIERLRALGRSMGDFGLALEEGCLTLKVTCWMDRARRVCCFLSCRQEMGKGVEGLCFEEE